jgi:hypothetical protein
LSAFIRAKATEALRTGILRAMAERRSDQRAPAPFLGPFGRASPGARRRVLWIAGAAALVLWVFLLVQDQEIEDTGGPGIVPFEVAGTSEQAREILADWGEQGREDARTSLIVDYAYLVAYSIFLAVGCTIAGVRLARRGMSRLARIGPLLGWAQFVAAACDAIENAALLRVLDGHTDVYPGIALYSAIPKFALAGLGLAYVIAGLVLGRGAGREPAPAA